MENMDVVEIILKEIETCGKTRYRIAQDTGITEAQLHRLVNGGSLKAETVGLLLEYFGYEIRKKKGRVKK
jgi:hypothetical protein